MESLQPYLYEIYGNDRDLWDIHAGYYRDIDFSKAWAPSPPLPYTPLPLRSPMRPVFELPTGTARFSQTDNFHSSQTLTIDISTRKLGLWSRIRRFIRTGKFIAVETIKHDIPLSRASTNPYNLPKDDKVRIYEWKAYGYWARPRVNEVECLNSPVVSENSITTETLEEVARTLRDEDGTKHPENWIPGLKHQSLPPRPSKWKVPQPGQPLPFPWEVQINPLLQHHLWGPSPLSWFVYSPPMQGAALHGRAMNMVPVGTADFCQPATYPFLTHMHFNAVSGDPAPRFPWPFTVVNERGIKVADVLEEIWKTFNQLVSDDELSSWSTPRRELSMCALQTRRKFLSKPGEPLTDDLRRCDSYGFMAFFRGIEPTVDGGGWMITFAPF